MLLLLAVLSLSLAAPALSQACTSSFCQNGGICVVVGGNPVCACPSGFIGKNCETVDGLGAQACAQAPCLNGATCEASGDQFKCLCAPGFYGTLCQESTATVAPNNCPPGSQNTSNVQCLPAEIIFMIEYAQGMTIFDLDHEGDFIKSLIDLWAVDNGQIRVGVVAYHDTVYEAIHIDDFPGDVPGLKDAVTRLTRRLSPSGINDLAGALDYVKITSFAGARPGVAKVVIPIVHMMPQDERSNVIDAATRLKDDCVTIIGLGIRGTKEQEEANGLDLDDVVYRDTMEQVVSWPGSSFYLEFADFTELENGAVFAPRSDDCPTNAPATV